LPSDLPGRIRVDVSALKVGDIIHVMDLEEVHGVEFVDGGDVAVVACKGVVEEVEESAAAEPSKQAAGTAQSAEAAAPEAKEVKAKEQK
jgi:large subunit ribosomal protein L25